MNNIPTVTIKKLVFLSITTFGIYELFWFYRRFKFFKDRENYKLPVLLLTILCAASSFILFKPALKLSEQKGYKNPYPANILALAFFVFSFITFVPDPYTYLSFGTFLPLIVVQKALNHSAKKENPNAVISSSFNTWELIGAGVGSILIVFLVTSYLFPDFYK